MFLMIVELDELKRKGLCFNHDADEDDQKAEVEKHLTCN